MNRLSKYRGFTLVELSIVIVIIGLIVAGVIGGQALVNQSKLRTIITEFNQFKIQLNAFQLEYDAIPGDMANAHDYWPGCNSGATAAQCNGNGDNYVVHDDNINNNETFRYWQHMGLAGLSQRQLSGVGNQFNCGEGCYISTTDKGLYFTHNIPSLASFRTPTITRNVIMYFPAANQPNFWRPSLTVPEAFSIDSKMDDGIANRGSLLAMHHNGEGANGCSAGHSSNGADYVAANLGDKATKRCLLAYLLK